MGCAFDVSLCGITRPGSKGFSHPARNGRGPLREWAKVLRRLGKSKLGWVDARYVRLCWQRRCNALRECEGIGATAMRDHRALLLACAITLR